MLCSLLSFVFIFYKNVLVSERLVSPIDLLNVIKFFSSILKTNCSLVRSTYFGSKNAE